jgi:hypothetical protein
VSQLSFMFEETRRESWEAKQGVLSDQKSRILSVFRERGSHGATIAEIAAIVAGGQSNRVCQAIKGSKGGWADTGHWAA